MDASDRLKRLGMTQKELYDELHFRRFNVSEGALTRYLAGNVKMHAQVVNMILLTLDDLEALKGFTTVLDIKAAPAAQKK